MADIDKPDDAKKPVNVYKTMGYRTDRYRAIYANSHWVVSSQSDIQIVLAQAGQVLGETKIEEVATLYLSPFQAKAMLAALANQIGVFEARYGEINTKAKEPPAGEA
jgi:hypothetical protein